jgi:RNA polymerase sigma-70 factor (ECF subfamily)
MRSTAWYVDAPTRQSWIARLHAIGKLLGKPPLNNGPFQWKRSCWLSDQKMDKSPHDSDRLLHLAAEGHSAAKAELLERYREKLRRMVAMRLDRRMAARIDPSDIVQETLHQAHQRLDDYFVARPASFYPWLRGIAWDRLVDLYRTHVDAEKRTVRKEQAWVGPDPEAVGELVHQIAISSSDNPRRQAMLAEMQQRVHAGLLELNELDREVLTLRYLEHLSVLEIAEILAITPSAATTRHLRALKRLRAKLPGLLDH